MHFPNPFIMALAAASLARAAFGPAPGSVGSPAGEEISYDRAYEYKTADCSGTRTGTHATYDAQDVPMADSTVAVYLTTKATYNAYSASQNGKCQGPVLRTVTTKSASKGDGCTLLGTGSQRIKCLKRAD